MSVLAIVLAAMVGLALGPPLRVVIFELAVASGEPPRRTCPRCRHRLVLRSSRLGASLALDGRCAICGERIAAPSGLVELATAAALALIAWRVHPTLVLVAFGLLALSGLVCGAVDVAVQRVPNVVLAPTFAALLALLIATGVTGHHLEALARAVIGGAAAFAFFTLLALVSSGLGFGDCKLAALWGLALGWVGWEALIAGVILGFVLAAASLLPRTLTGRLDRSHRVAFAPFIVLGAFTVLLVAS